MQHQEEDELSHLSAHAVIAGFGVPGRVVADHLHAQGTSYCVVEQNVNTVDRCRKSGLHIVDGDAANPEVLRRAGIERASLFVCAVPNDEAMYAAVEAARKLNPTLRIIARCRYVSSGIEATRRGADEVVVEEKAVAQAFEALLAPPSTIPPISPTARASTPSGAASP